MLKIIDYVSLEYLANKYKLEYDNDTDYECGLNYAVYEGHGYSIDIITRRIKTYDYCDLVDIYEMIQDGFIERED